MAADVPVALPQQPPAEVEAAAVEGSPPRVEGWLRKCSTHFQQWHFRYVLLTADGKLQTFTEKPSRQGDRESGAAKTLDLDIHGASAASVEFNRVFSSDLPWGFTVAIGSQTVRFAAESSVLRREWLEALRSAGAKIGPSDLPPSDSPPEPAVAVAVERAVMAPEAAPPPAAGGTPPREHAAQGEAAHGAVPLPQRPPEAPPPQKAPPPKGKAPPPPKAKKKAAAPPKKASDLPLERKLHLSQVTGPPDAQAWQSSIDPTDVDLGGLAEIFRRPQPPPEPVPKHHPGVQHLAVVELLPQNVAQKIAIHLFKLHVDTEALAGALERLAPEECPLAAEDALRLVEVLPSPDVLRPIAGYGTRPDEDPERLRDVERQLRPLARLTRLAQRLRLLRLSKSLGERVGDALTQMASLQAACDAVRSSGVFIDLLQLVMVLFNYVNFGEAPSSDGIETGRAAPRVPHVQSLMRLKETKAYRGPFPRYHMLHFALQQLLRQRPELSRDELQRELGALPRAATLSLSQMQLGLSSLMEDLAFVERELHGHGHEYVPPSEEPPLPAPEEAPAPEPPPLVPAAGEPAATRGVHFAMDAQDSDEEDVASTASAPTLKARRGLLERLLAQAIDALSFAEAWKKGSAVLGRAQLHVEATLPEGGDAPPPGALRRLRPSGEWRRYWCEVRASLLICYRIEGQRVVGTTYVALPGAEILPMDSMCASGPLLSHPQPHSFEVRPRDGGRPEAFCCQSAREAWRWIDCLEVEAHRRGMGYLSLHKGGWRMFGSCWQRLFCALASRGAAGGDQAQGPRLLAFARPRDCAEGAAPERSWPLESTLVRALDDEGASVEARHLAQLAPIGLELEDFETGQCWRFACDSVAEQRSWLEAFDTLQPDLHSGSSSSSGARPIRHTLHASFRDGPVAEVDRGQLFDLFSECATPVPELPDDGDSTPFDAAVSSSAPAPPLRSFRLDEGGPGPPASGPLVLLGAERATAATPTGGAVVDGVRPVGEDRPPPDQGLVHLESREPRDNLDAPTGDAGSSEEGPAEAAPVQDALSQLRRLEEEMKGAVEQWGRTLAATESHCRALLRFFFLEAPPGARLAQASTELLEALATFEGQVAEALDDLDRHGFGGTATARTTPQTPRATRGTRTSMAQRRKSSGQVPALEASGGDVGLSVPGGTERVDGQEGSE